MNPQYIGSGKQFRNIFTLKESDELYCFTTDSIWIINISLFECIKKINAVAISDIEHVIFCEQKKIFYISTKNGLWSYEIGTDKFANIIIRSADIHNFTMSPDGKFMVMNLFTETAKESLLQWGGVPRVKSPRMELYEDFKLLHIIDYQFSLPREEMKVHHNQLVKSSIKFISNSGFIYSVLIDDRRIYLYKFHISDTNNFQRTHMEGDGRVFNAIELDNKNLIVESDASAKMFDENFNLIGEIRIGGLHDKIILDIDINKIILKSGSTISVYSTSLQLPHKFNTNTLVDDYVKYIGASQTLLTWMVHISAYDLKTGFIGKFEIPQLAFLYEKLSNDNRYLIIADKHNIGRYDLIQLQITDQKHALLTGELR